MLLCSRAGRWRENRKDRGLKLSLGTLKCWDHDRKNYRVERHGTKEEHVYSVYGNLG